MDVRTIRDRIVDLSHHGIGNDFDINAKALGWLNSAYHELMDELVPYLPVSLQRREDVATDVNGAATLANGIYRLVRVVERGQGITLPTATLAEVLDAEVAGISGAPQRCYADGAAVKVFPPAAVDLTVLYVPRVSDLAEDDPESAVLVPPSLHSVLVWGGLTWSALFDRGFLSQSELLIYQQQWQAGKSSVKLSLLGNGPGTLRVQPFGLV